MRRSSTRPALRSHKRSRHTLGAPSQHAFHVREAAGPQDVSELGPQGPVSTSIIVTWNPELRRLRSQTPSRLPLAVPWHQPLCTPCAWTEIRGPVPTRKCVGTSIRPLFVNTSHGCQSMSSRQSLGRRAARHTPGLLSMCSLSISVRPSERSVWKFSSFKKSAQEVWVLSSPWS